MIAPLVATQAHCPAHSPRCEAVPSFGPGAPLLTKREDTEHNERRKGESLPNCLFKRSRLYFPGVSTGGLRVATNVDQCFHCFFFFSTARKKGGH